MKPSIRVTGLLLAALASLSLIGSASAAAPKVKPKAGHWEGFNKASPYPVFSMDVTKRKVSNEIGSAPSNQEKCPGKLSFAIPQKVIKIKKGGHFKETSDDYQPHVLVTVKGTFTSRTKAKGYLSTTWPKKHRECSAKLTWKATFPTPSS
jgi:hypothetical protein